MTGDKVIRGQIGSRTLGFRLLLSLITLSSYPLLFPAVSGAAEVTPLYSFRVLGGQYFFEEDKGNLSGNANLILSPSIKLDDDWTIQPSYHGYYQGTKQVVDLVGAGTLFQQQQDHRGSVKAIYNYDEDIKFKGTASYKHELLRETRDEKWGKGLFDYQKPGAGLEAEYIYSEPFSVRVGYDFYWLHFPNYKTLESQQQFDFNGDPIARELVGGHVLDAFSHTLSFGANRPVFKERAILEGDLSWTYQNFPNQPVVDAAGQFESSLRRDIIQRASVTLRLPKKLKNEKRLSTSLGLAFTHVQSNQNNYDAAQNRFLPRFYNSYEFQLTPGAQLRFGQGKHPTTLDLGFVFWYRKYPHRLSQDASGLYTGESVRQLNGMVTAGASYLMAANFNVLVNLQYGRASSNMDFERFYRYNFDTLTYLVGVSYDY